MQRPVLLKEIVGVLAEHERLRCDLAVERKGKCITVALHIDDPNDYDDEPGVNGLEILALFHELTYLSDVGQIRAFASRYDIDAAKLEALLPNRKEK